MLQYALADQSSSVQRWVDTAADEITAVNHQQHRRLGVAAVGPDDDLRKRHCRDKIQGGAHGKISAFFQRQPVGQLRTAQADSTNHPCQKCIHLQRTPDIGRQRGQKSRAPATTDLQPLLPHLHQIILHAPDVAQVDQIALVAARKV